MNSSIFYWKVWFSFWKDYSLVHYKVCSNWLGFWPVDVQKVVKSSYGIDIPPPDQVHAMYQRNKKSKECTKVSNEEWRAVGLLVSSIIRLTIRVVLEM